LGKMKVVATDTTARTSRDELRAWVDDKLPDQRELSTSVLSSGELAAPPASRTGRARAARQQRRLTERLADTIVAPRFDCKPLWSTLRSSTPPDRGHTTCRNVRTVDSLLVSAVTSGHGPHGSSVLQQKVAWEHDTAEKAEMAELLSRRRHKQRRNARAFEQACADREARYRYS
jgi:hypothetical protein